MTFLILGGVVLLIVVMAVQIYNRLVTLSNRYKNAFSQVEVQLQRRYDLIPNLVETAKGYLKHEKDTLEGVIQARNQAVMGLKEAASNPGDEQAIQGLMGAETALNGAVGKLFALAEAYPDLKGNQNMMQLSEELTSTENKVSFSRQAFNDQVTDYNTYKQTFPPVLVAAMFGHGKDATLLEFDSEVIKDAPKVSFDR